MVRNPQGVKYTISTISTSSYERERIQVKVLFNNRQPLNALRDEVLKNKRYNAINGLLTKLDKEIELKKREKIFDGFIANNKYKNIQTKIKNAGLRNKYMKNKTMTLNNVRGKLNGLLKGTIHQMRMVIHKPQMKNQGTHTRM